LRLPVGHNGPMKYGPARSTSGVARACAAGAAVTMAMLLSGCTSVVSGHALRDQDAAPIDVPPLRESQLADVMLGVDELNSILDASDMAVVSEMEEMSDNSRAVSDPDCLGVIFGAEEKVYDGSDWTAVRDQVVREPGDDKEHWVEQTVVLYPAAENAKKFFDDSNSNWEQCGGFSVAVDDDESSYIWQVNDVERKDDLISQVATQQDSGGWECQHALSLVSNVTVETWACAFGINDEAVEMAQEIVKSAAKK
jgi:PknH-like extracellular domain